jgi:hypothetical protein
MVKQDQARRREEWAGDGPQLVCFDECHSGTRGHEFFGFLGSESARFAGAGRGHDIAAAGKACRPLARAGRCSGMTFTVQISPDLPVSFTKSERARAEFVAAVAHVANGATGLVLSNDT